jgi:hypothetical protein
MYLAVEQLLQNGLGRRYGRVMSMDLRGFELHRVHFFHRKNEARRGKSEVTEIGGFS